MFGFIALSRCSGKFVGDFNIGRKILICSASSFPIGFIVYLV